MINYKINQNQSDNILNNFAFSSWIRAINLIGYLSKLLGSRNPVVMNATTTNRIKQYPRIAILEDCLECIHRGNKIYWIFFSL